MAPLKKYLIKEEETDSPASRPLIGLEEDGELYIDAGQVGNLVTQLGSDESKFRPYIDKIDETIYLYTYQYSKDFIPANFKSVDDFLNTFREQAPENESLQNYIRLSTEKMYEYLKKVKLINENTAIIVVNTGSGLLNQIVTAWRDYHDNIYDDITFVKENVKEEELYIVEDAPDEVKKYLSPLLDEIQKVDAHMSLEDLDLDDDAYLYIRGFIDIYPEKLTTIDGNIIMLSDFYSNAFQSQEAIDHIKKITGYAPPLCIMLGKKV